MDTPSDSDNAGSAENLTKFSFLLQSPNHGTGTICCHNKAKGCEWIGEAKDLENHLEKIDGCQYANVRCPDCNTEHIKSKCPLQIIDCQFCFTTGMRQFIEGPEHKVDCFGPCPNKCGIERISCEDIDEHTKICPTAIVQCDYHAMGCECSMVRRDMEAHSKENVTEHLLLTRNFLDKITQEYQDFKEQHRYFVLTTDITIRDLGRKIQLIALKNVQAEERINELEKQLKAMKHVQKEGVLQSHDVHSWLSISWDGPNNVQAVTAGDNDSIPVLPVYVKMSGFDKHRRNRARWFSDPFFSHEGGYKLRLQVKASGLGSTA